MMWLTHTARPARGKCSTVVSTVKVVSYMWQVEITGWRIFNIACFPGTDCHVSDGVTSSFTVYKLLGTECSFIFPWVRRSENCILL
jgi:hypothetical protein